MTFRIFRVCSNFSVYGRNSREQNCWSEHLDGAKAVKLPKLVCFFCNFSFKKRKVNITFLQNNAFSKNHAGVRKRGQSAPRHQNILSFFVLCSLLLDRRSWSALPVGRRLSTFSFPTLCPRGMRLSTFSFPKRKSCKKKLASVPLDRPCAWDGI